VSFRFGDLRFDAETRRIWLGERAVRLSPKAFELLALLIDRRPRPVSKEEIHQRLWPGTYVSDSNLPSLMSEIREAIEDHRREPRLLRTVHGFGYAFQAEDGSEGKESRAAEPNGWLIGPPAEIALFAGENVLGREGPGVILLNSTTVSRRHVRIAIDAGAVIVEDLGSKNGTYVNDRRIEAPTPVLEGDQVRIGSLLFTFRHSPPAGSTETVSHNPPALQS
jgi:DNA-binding winged helix-turn-helix (wHTH) protein